MQLSDLSLRLHALSVLRGVLRLPLVNAYAETLSAFDRSAADFADRYGALCAARFACGDISRSFLNAVHFDVNTLTDTIDAPADALLAAATHDIEVLNGLLALSGSQLCEAAALHFDADALRSLPDFAARKRPCQPRPRAGLLPPVERTCPPPFKIHRRPHAHPPIRKTRPSYYKVRGLVFC